MGLAIHVFFVFWLKNMDAVCVLSYDIYDARNKDILSS